MSDRSLLVGLVMVSLIGCGGCSSDTGNSAAPKVALRMAPRGADHVGCAPAAFAPDGKPDLHFQVTTTPAPLGEIAAIELRRSGSHVGIWTTGTANFALGVTRAQSPDLIAAGSGTIKAADYGPAGLDLFACDDGATSAGDSFVAKVTLVGGVIQETAALSYTPAP